MDWIQDVSFAVRARDNVGTNKPDKQHCTTDGKNNAGKMIASNSPNCARAASVLLPDCSSVNGTSASLALLRSDTRHALKVIGRINRMNWEKRIRQVVSSEGTGIFGMHKKIAAVPCPPSIAKAKAVSKDIFPPGMRNAVQNARISARIRNSMHSAIAGRYTR